MLVTVNGRIFYDNTLLLIASPTMNSGFELPVHQTLTDRIISHVKEHSRAYLTAGYALIMMSAPSPALAATAKGGMSLILLMQKASFWGGLGIASWGVIEMQLDYPGWKGRIFRAVGGYIVILLLPLAFLELQNNLQVDVWSQIQESMQKSPLQPR